MDKEIKISLPFYKIVYALFFVVILSLIRGVTFTNEIGSALEAPMAMLAAVFCADTYAQEVISKRAEIQRLYPMKSRIRSVVRRIVIQELFLLLLAIIGYGLFLLFQKPFIFNEAQQGMGNEIEQFFLYLAAVLITLGFWGILSNVWSCLFGNMWVGMGGCLVVWLVTFSSFGERYLGSWNLFSYTFRNVENNGDLSWMWGKAVCICFGFIMMALLPGILKKRG